jgi:hypothetical protein
MRIDYENPEVVARQNIAPNAGCDIDGVFYDMRNCVYLLNEQADRIEELDGIIRQGRERIEELVSMVNSKADRIEELQAENARLRDALYDIAEDRPTLRECEGSFRRYYIARAALAELKGEDRG